MKLICKLFRQDPDTREGIITATSGFGIIVNILIAAAKVAVGLLASSIAIVSEGANNAADALTSVLTLVGTKLAAKHPDAKHPFGYGRIEYLTGLVISVLILVTGVEMLINAVKLIIHPEDPEISYIALIILGVSAVIKFFLGLFTIRMGKRADSAALEGVGVEGRNDAFISLVTILSAVLFLVFEWNIDAYVGALMSLVIIKAGIDILKNTVSDLLGRPGEQELAETLYGEIRATDGILGAADMMLHNYGPDAWSGSVNVEIDHGKTVDEVYGLLHDLQLRIMHEHRVIMVFGIYAVDNDSPFIKQLRTAIGQFVEKHEHVKSFHAVYLQPGSDLLYCDLVVDYDLRDWDALRADFIAYMGEHYPDRRVQLTVETEYV